MRSARLPWILAAATVVLFVTGNVLGYVTHDPQTAGGWGGGGSAALVAVSLSLLTFGLVGALIAARLPANPIGWLLIAIGLSWATDSALEGYARYGLQLHPGSLPGAAYANAVDAWMWMVSISLMGIFLFQLFPDGRPLSPRWRVVMWISAGLLAVAVLAAALAPGRLTDATVSSARNPLGVESLPVLGSIASLALSLTLVCIPLSTVSLILRYRRSHGTARLQLKWLVSATAAVVIVYAVVITLSTYPEGKAPLWLMVLQDGTIVSFCVIPFAIGAAVLRYRLYEIDVIVRRTVVYAVLVTVLAAVYLTGVTALGWIGREATGASGTLAVTLSTLLVAASFQPLRTRIQAAVDRRFYRRRYDAERAASLFTSRLRGQVDLEALNRELLGVINDTVQPAHASLWLREG
jgi:hypothetical protein